jgi:putative endopeptidase
MNNPRTIESLTRATGLDLLGYFHNATEGTAARTDGSTVVNVMTPSYFTSLGPLLAATPLSTLREYAQWTALTAFAGDLTPALASEHFRFFGTVVSGTPQQSSRARICQAKATSLLPDAMSRRFVEVAFPSETEAEARDMLRHVQLALLARLPQLTWMTPDDKLKAAEKLMKMQVSGVSGSHTMQHCLTHERARCA